MKARGNDRTSVAASLVLGTFLLVACSDGRTGGGLDAGLPDGWTTLRDTQDDGFLSDGACGVGPCCDRGEPVPFGEPGGCGPGEACDEDGECQETAECNVLCPPLSEFTVACNAQNHCEYTRAASWGDEVYIWVPPGAFAMGATEYEAALPSGCDWVCEQPIHVVDIEQGYWIGKYEVTRGAYESCEDEDCPWPLFWEYDPDNSELPMGGIDWFSARAFCGWRGAGFDLCSEAQWERAAKGTSHRLYPWGDDFPSRVYANCNERSCHDGWEEASPVGSFPAGVSPVGCLDLAGNVSEWVLDLYHESYAVEGRPDDGSAWIGDTSPGPRDSRVTRGGSYDSGFDIRTSSRSHVPAEIARAGIRCCRNVPPYLSE